VRACPADGHRYTQAELEVLQPQVQVFLHDHFEELGIGIRSVIVGLAPGQDAVAARLEARFHDAVSITVGAAPYHCGIGTAPKCPPLTGTGALPPGLHLMLRLGSSTTKVGTYTHGLLVVREDRSQPLAMDPGNPITAMIVVRGTRTVVGSYSGGIAGTGLGVQVHDGQERAIETLIGVARCDGRPGSALPPGTYGVRAGISSNEGPPEFLAPEVPLTITR
jgi:hypothetical protein